MTAHEFWLGVDRDKNSDHRPINYSPWQKQPPWVSLFPLLFCKPVMSSSSERTRALLGVSLPFPLAEIFELVD